MTGTRWSAFPMLMGKLFNSGIYNWRYHTEPVERLNGRSLYWPRGKVLGGSSTINGMLYVRGNSHDFDRWAQLGLSAWSYEDVLKSFLRSESHVERRDEFHGRDGELTVCRARGGNPLFDTFIEAGRQAGYPVNDDFNGANQEGFGRYDFTIRNGRRWSTASAFLRPAMKRPNLTVMTDAHANRITVSDGEATGVEVSGPGGTRAIRAAREVVVCAGAVNSPQLLMLSGIGPVDELARHGIGVVRELPGVGANLQDHVDCVLAYECPRPMTLYRDLRADRLIWSVVKGLATGTGIATTFPYEAGAFVKSRPDLVAPDIQMHFMPALEKTANLHFPNPFRRKSGEINHGFSIRVGPVTPESRGVIRLRSPDPADPAGNPPELPCKQVGPGRDPGRDQDRPRRDPSGGLRRPSGQGTRARPETPVRPGVGGMAQIGGNDDIPSGRHLQDGERSDGGSRRSVARARSRAAAGGRRLGHAGDHQRKHQCSGDHDRRAVGALHRRRAIAVRRPIWRNTDDR